MALSPYQAPPFRTMDDAQHIPTSAQHGAKHTMASVALTQQMSVSDTTTVAGKFRALYMVMVQSKPSNDSTHTPPSSNRGHKLLFLHAYTLIFSAPCAEYTNNLQRDPSVSPGTDKASSHTSQHLMEICWHHTGATSYLGYPYTNIFSAMMRRRHTTYSEILAYNKGQKVPSHTSQHLPENSWTHQGDANVMASLHHHRCDAPIYGWACIFITFLLPSTTISTGPTVLPWLGSSQG